MGELTRSDVAQSQVRREYLQRQHVHMVSEMRVRRTGEAAASHKNSQKANMPFLPLLEKLAESPVL